MQSPGRRYLARQATAQGNHHCQSKVRFHAVGQKKRVVHRQKARIHIRIRSVDLHFVQSTKHKFCVSQGFIPAGATGRHVTMWEQVFFIFVLVLQSRKRVAEPHPCLQGKTTFRQSRPLMLNWHFEKSIATIVIQKLSICKIHWKQFNTRLLVENSTCKMIIHTKLELSTLCFHWKYSCPCKFNFCAGLGSCGHPTDLAGGRSGTSQQDCFKTIFLRFPWVGRDQAVTRINLQLELDSDQSWLHCQLEFVLVNWCPFVALRWATRPSYDLQTWNSPGR